MTEQKVPRRRGRPRGGSDSRARIIAAAVDDFGEKGYDGATIRSIAARAGVDSALVHHYFGTKADLFAEAVGIPLRPDVDVPGILAGPRDEIGERLIRYVLEAFEQPEVRRRGVMLLRTAIGSRLTTPLLAGFLSRELLSRVAGSLDTDDAELRASLVASQIAGMLIARYVLRLPALAAAPVEELVDRVGPTVQRYLFD
ncbi:TetR family transcriptional regulator [Microbacterium oxydans]|jgi:AcrR family transcriptional regulator|uniref:TetR/AcrR family transcriptional regulator n=1 Tax=Microbacterium oxydans TaxID=82380 RepID=UPI00226BA6A0|nr:TetR family transcriptional regulator [Microbacterium oxydans]WAA66814.1 TetR family transcriptional regulator [Microbacterium oxydans]